jgi:hypothetical protein
MVKAPNSKFPVAASCIVLAGLTGCAGVDFYSDPSLNEKTGIPVFYAPKPYLLVARTGKPDKPVEVTVIYLSDDKKVIWAKPRSGWGSSNLTMALANGQLTNFGQVVDAKIPETITALAGLLTARAGADKTAAEADKIRAETKQAGIAAAEAGARIAAVADDMAKKIKAGMPGIAPEDVKQLNSIAQALSAAAVGLKDPTRLPSAPEQYGAIKSQKDLLEKYPAPTGKTAKDQSLKAIQGWAAELGKVLAEAAQKGEPPAAATPPTFELYEIVQSPDKPTTLRRVDAP